MQCKNFSFLLGNNEGEIVAKRSPGSSNVALRGTLARIDPEEILRKEQSGAFGDVLPSIEVGIGRGNLHKHLFFYLILREMKQ